jgi:hypothetical protein
MLASPWFGLSLIILAAGALSLFSGLLGTSPSSGPASHHAAVSLTAGTNGCNPMVLA